MMVAANVLCSSWLQVSPGMIYDLLGAASSQGLIALPVASDSLGPHEDTLDGFVSQAFAVNGPRFGSLTYSSACRRSKEMLLHTCGRHQDAGPTAVQRSMSTEKFACTVHCFSNLCFKFNYA